MSSESVIRLGEVIFAGIDRNPYLNELYNNILFNYALYLFGIEKVKPKPLNITDALKFADVLSKSTDDENSDRHKIWAQEIVALLKALYPDNYEIKDYLGAVLLNTENFLGLSKNVPGFYGHTLFDRFYTEYSMEQLRIPAEQDKHFFRAQKTVYDHLNDPYFSYSGPTSMGKSYIMRMFIKKQIMDGTKMNFAIIVPTKALINEVYTKIIDDLKITDSKGYLSEQNYTIITSAGALQLMKEKQNFIFVLTPERLLYLLIGYPNIKIDYLFIDEAHKISTKDSRSVFYYKVIDMLYKKQKPHFIFASPNIPNPEVYLGLIPNIEAKEKWKLSTSFSPVSQIKILVDLVCGEIKTFNSYTEQLENVTCFSKGAVLGQVISLINRSGNGGNAQSIVYFNSKEKTVEYALEYANMQPEQYDSALIALANEIKSQIHEDYYLSKTITKGVAYHIGYLPAGIRQRIEELYRGHKIRTLFCTSTLLEGVNLPADNLFITTYGKGKGKSKMKAVDFKNLIGRVGRIEYNLYGNVFLIRIESTTNNENFLKLLKEKVPAQELSLVTELSETQKKQIVDCLLAGDITLKNLDLKTKESYQLIRKFAVILLRDITSDNHSVVRQAFKAYLYGDVESKIIETFKESGCEPDDDINVSVDQRKNLSWAIANEGLCYPALNSNRTIEYSALMDFLYELSRIFKWNKYDSATIGNNNKLKWYGVILRRWINGTGLGFIMKESLDYYSRNPDKRVLINNKLEIYNGTAKHNNSIIGDTLEAIEHVILFSLSNYFLKFSEVYKLHHNIHGDLKNDWYEYIEYGTTNPLTIFLQRNGFSRDTAMFIREHLEEYVVDLNIEEPKLRRSIRNCKSASVRQEVEGMLYNIPELFVD